MRRFALAAMTATVAAATALAAGGGQAGGGRLLAGAGLHGGAVMARAYLLAASLDSRQEAPHAKGASGATGTFTATITLSGGRGSLAWRLAFSQLSGPALAAHVHLGAPGTAGRVVIPLCAPCTSGAHGVFRGPLGGNQALLRALLGGGAYVNVHTKRNPGGEIRGQLRDWLSYQPSSKTAKLTLIGAYANVNNGFNFDGYAKGALTVKIPTGWKVTVACSNEGAVNHSCAITKSAGAKKPVFSGASSPDPTKGLAKGKSATFSFTAGSPGSYRITCLVPGHEPAGMWDVLQVTTGGTPSLALAGSA